MRAYSTSRGRQIIRDTLGATCREGIALVTVLAVLSLLTILTAGSLASTGRLRGGSELAATEGRLLADGEYALNGVILDWGERQLPELGVGATAQLPVTLPATSSGRNAVVTVTRLSSSTFWLVSEVQGTDGIRRRFNRIVTLPRLPFDSLGTLTAAGTVIVGSGGALEVLGNEDSGGGCTDPEGSIVVPAGSSVLTDGGTQVTGIEVVHREISLTVYSLVDSADSGWVARAAAVVHGPNSTTVLQSGEQLTVGSGDLTITGGSGAGVLFVEGSLTIRGEVDFTGLIVARGGIEIEDGSVQVTGLILSGPGADPQSPAITRIGGATTLRSSHCVARSAYDRLIPPRPSLGRSWAELY